MKKNLIILFLAVLVRPATSQNWVSITDNPVVNFDMPESPGYIDTINTKMYYYRPDSLLGLTVHVITSAQVEDATGLFHAALDAENGDSLRAMVNLMISLSGHELVSITNSNYNNIPGVEVGISVLNPDDSMYNSLIFMRMFYFGHTFVTFSAASYASDIERLSYTKSQFFSSVEFKKP